MSYEKVKSISVKDGKTFITSRSNNDNTGHSRWELQGEAHEVLRGILGGTFQIQPSANNYKVYLILLI